MCDKFPFSHSLNAMGVNTQVATFPSYITQKNNSDLY